MFLDIGKFRFLQSSHCRYHSYLLDLFALTCIYKILFITSMYRLFQEPCKQECIPVGCVPSAAVGVCLALGGGGLLRGLYLAWGVYLVLGGCTWSQGGVPGPGECTWSRGVSAALGVYLVQGGCTWSQQGGEGSVLGGYLVRGVYLVPGRGVPGLGGVPSPWGVSASGGCLLIGVYLVRYFPPCGQTHACKNITFATSFRTVISDKIDIFVRSLSLLNSLYMRFHRTLTLAITHLRLH